MQAVAREEGLHVLDQHCGCIDYFGCVGRGFCGLFGEAGRLSVREVKQMFKELALYSG